MPSRKRSKAKERRLRQEQARVARGRLTWEELFQWSEKETTIQCNHGCDDLPVYESDLVAGFISQSFYNDDINTVLLTDMLASSVRTYSDVWKTDHLRIKAAEILTNLTANYILHEAKFGEKDAFKDYELLLVKVIIVLEEYNGDLGSTFLKPKVSGKMRDLVGVRDIYKFVSKRLPCSCLKELYATARKSHPKMGCCSHCVQLKKRETLLICSKCRFCQYCDVNCQAASWKNGHKDECRRHEISRKHPGTYRLKSTP